MPDHGVRTPANYSDMAIGILGQHPYGWAGTPAYRAQDLPTNNWFAADSFAYERIDWEKFVAQAKSTGAGTTVWNLSNPPFLGAGQVIGASGVGQWRRTPTWMTREGAEGGPARILRGYLRRASVNPSDPASFARLYFMWNPDTLIRSYIATLDVGGLDPANVMNIDSPEAPGLNPQYASFAFELYFDRETECAVMQDHPGVLVDLQAFDAIGNVTGAGTRSGLAANQKTPTPVPAATPGATPGTIVGQAGFQNVDMGETAPGGDWSMRTNIIVQATPITAVFSPSLAFYGTLESAEATFEKFTSRMTPTRMRLSISMRLYVVGKLTNQTVQNATPGLAGTSASGAVSGITPGASSGGLTGTQAGAADANTAKKTEAANWALQQVGRSYDAGRRSQGAPCNTGGPNVFDCSSLCWRAYKVVGWTDILGLGGDNRCTNPPITSEFLSVARARKDVWEVYELTHNIQNDAQSVANLQVGDMLVRPAPNGHMVMFTGFTGTPPSAAEVMTKSVCTIVQAADPSSGVIKSTKTGQSLTKDMTAIIRPKPIKTSSTGAVGGGGVGSF